MKRYALVGLAGFLAGLALPPALRWAFWLVRVLREAARQVQTQDTVEEFRSTLQETDRE